MLRRTSLSVSSVRDLFECGFWGEAAPAIEFIVIAGDGRLVPFFVLSVGVAVIRTRV